MTDLDAGHASRATQPLETLRDMLRDAREMHDAARLHETLIDVIGGLINHAQRQERMIEDLRSDLRHKQGIVSNIDGSNHKRAPAGIVGID